MSIITIFEMPTMTPQKYDAAVKGLDAVGQNNPDGREYHAASVKDDGSIVVTDIWTAPEQLEKFGEALIPVLENVGVSPVEPQISPVHNVIQG